MFEYASTAEAEPAAPRALSSAMASSSAAAAAAAAGAGGRTGAAEPGAEPRKPGGGWKGVEDDASAERSPSMIRTRRSEWGTAREKCTKNRKIVGYAHIYDHVRQLYHRPTNRIATGACTPGLRRGRRCPARLGTEGRRHTHTCHARPGRRAPQVHGNCIIGRQRFNEAAGCARLVYGDVRACSRTDGHTSMQPIVHCRVCTTPSSTHPYYPKWCWSARGAAAGALARPCGT
jgi:hypothetical protein